jgi:hypothetical protein
MTMRWAACVACGAGIFAATPCPGQEVLHRNGPWTTRKHFDCLPPDTKTSLLQTNLGLRFYGFGHQRQGNNRVADDFVVPEGEYWIIERVWFPAYQTDSGYQQSTMTWLSLMVWDGPPDQAESVVLFGDPDTNRLESSVFADVFRHSDQQCLLNRPVFLNEGACFSSVPCPMRLGPGTYWVDWQADGTLPSGPWVPPVTYAGEQGKPGANAIQFVGSEGWWVPLADAEWVPQDLPFIIEGRRTTCPADIDVDEQTGQADLATLLGAFGTRRGDRDYCAAADLDANGIIGHADLATLLANWGCQDGRCKCKIIFLGGEALLKCDRKGGEAGDFKFKVTLTNRWSASRARAPRSSSSR